MNKTYTQETILTWEEYRIVFNRIMLERLEASQYKTDNGFRAPEVIDYYQAVYDNATQFLENLEQGYLVDEEYRVNLSKRDTEIVKNILEDKVKK